MLPSLGSSPGSCKGTNKDVDSVAPSILLTSFASLPTYDDQKVPTAREAAELRVTAIEFVAYCRSLL